MPTARPDCGGPCAAGSRRASPGRRWACLSSIPVVVRRQYRFDDWSDERQVGRERSRCLYPDPAEAARRGPSAAPPSAPDPLAAALGSRHARPPRVSDCVTALLRDQPFFGSLALRLPIRPDAARETLASDGREIRYSPDWVANTDADLIKTAIGRVVLACALKHHTRRASAIPGAGSTPRSSSPTASCATRASSSRPTRKPGTASAWSRPTTACPSRRKTSGEGSDGPPSEADGGGAAGPQPDADDDDRGGEDDDGEPQKQEPMGEGEGEGRARRRGRGRGRRRRRCRHGASADDGDPQPRDDSSGDSDLRHAAELRSLGHRGGDGRTGRQRRRRRRRPGPARCLRRGAGLGRGHAPGAQPRQGARRKAPGAVEETVRDAHRSTLDWRSLLRRYMTDAAARDYSWSVPNRRFIDSGLYLPSIRSEGMGTLAVIIDTSGSVDSDALAAFWSEVREVAAEIEPERIVVLQVDAAVQDEEHYAPGELPERIVVKGRWGTDFRPGFARLAEQGIRPAVCLYFTDMDCDRYPEAGARTSMWCGATIAPPPGCLRNPRPGASTSGLAVDPRHRAAAPPLHPAKSAPVLSVAQQLLNLRISCSFQ